MRMVITNWNRSTSRSFRDRDKPDQISADRAIYINEGPSDPDSSTATCKLKRMTP